MTIPDRHYSSGEEYRFGFQGQETDDEVNGQGNSIYFKYRVHDPRIGRFASVDPLAKNFPWNSQYSFSENRVVDRIELEGAETALPMYLWKYQKDFHDYGDYYTEHGTHGRLQYVDGDYHFFNTYDKKDYYFDQASNSWQEHDVTSAKSFWLSNGYVPTPNDLGRLQYRASQNDRFAYTYRKELEMYAETGTISSPVANDEFFYYMDNMYGLNRDMAWFWTMSGIAMEGAGLAEGSFGGGAVTRNRFGGYGKGVYTHVGMKPKVVVKHNLSKGDDFGSIEINVKKNSGGILSFNGRTRVESNKLHIDIDIKGKNGTYSDHSNTNTSFKELFGARSQLKTWGMEQGYEGLTIGGHRHPDSSSANPGREAYITIY